MVVCVLQHVFVFGIKMTYHRSIEAGLSSQGHIWEWGLADVWPDSLMTLELNRYLIVCTVLGRDGRLGGRYLFLTTRVESVGKTVESHYVEYCHLGGQFRALEVPFDLAPIEYDTDSMEEELFVKKKQLC